MSSKSRSLNYLGPHTSDSSFELFLAGSGLCRRAPSSRIYVGEFMIQIVRHYFFVEKSPTCKGRRAAHADIHSLTNSTNRSTNVAFTICTFESSITIPLAANNGGDGSLGSRGSPDLPTRKFPAGLLGAFAGTSLGEPEVARGSLVSISGEKERMRGLPCSKTLPSFLSLEGLPSHPQA